MDQVFDLSLFEAADTAVLEVQTAKKDGPLMFNGQPVTIELCGPGSDAYATAQAKVDAASQARAFAAIRGKAPKDAAAENRRLQAEKFAACTKALNNFPIPGGALALYTNQKLGYITAQVAEFIEDWGNFPSASSTT
jgi:hypothetical protein